MSWKSSVRLAAVLFSGFLAAIPLFSLAYRSHIDGNFDKAHYLPQSFSELSVEEINRRTLKAADEIKSALK